MSRLLKGLDAARRSRVEVPAPLLLDGPDAAAYLGLSESEFRRMRAEGSMCRPRRVPGRSTAMWHRADLDEWSLRLGKGDALPARRGKTAD